MVYGMGFQARKSCQQSLNLNRFSVWCGICYLTSPIIRLFYYRVSTRGYRQIGQHFPCHLKTLFNFLSINMVNQHQHPSRARVQTSLCVKLVFGVEAT